MTDPYDDAFTTGTSAQDQPVGKEGWESGQKVDSADAWTHRRKEILNFFEREVYGKKPAQPLKPEYTVTEDWTPALDGKAERKQVAISMGGNGSTVTINVLLYRPVDREQAAPVFVGLNFIGNASIHPDPAIGLHTNWTIGSEDEGVIDHRATVASRGKKNHVGLLRTLLSEDMRSRPHIVEI